MNTIVMQPHLKELLKSLPQPKIQYPTKVIQPITNLKYSADIVYTGQDPVIK